MPHRSATPNSIAGRRITPVSGNTLNTGVLCLSFFSRRGAKAQRRESVLEREIKTLRGFAALREEYDLGFLDDLVRRKEQARDQLNLL